MVYVAPPISSSIPTEEQLLTAVEVAAYFRKTVKTIRNWARLGKIPATKPGGHDWLFRRGEIESWHRYQTRGWDVRRQRRTTSA